MASERPWPQPGDKGYRVRLHITEDDTENGCTPPHGRPRMPEIPEDVIAEVLFFEASPEVQAKHKHKVLSVTETSRLNEFLQANPGAEWPSNDTFRIGSLGRSTSYMWYYGTREEALTEAARIMGRFARQCMRITKQLRCWANGFE